jgi:hypothetical protein
MVICFSDAFSTPRRISSSCAALIGGSTWALQSG